MDEVSGAKRTETPMEDKPSSPKQKASSTSLRVSLLGQSFTDIEGTVQPKTPYARAEEEMEKYCKAPPLPLTEDPKNWWHAHEVTFPLLSTFTSIY